MAICSVMFIVLVSMVILLGVAWLRLNCMSLIMFIVVGFDNTDQCSLGVTGLSVVDHE